jgi:hypothetical protein
VRLSEHTVDSVALRYESPFFLVYNKFAPKKQGAQKYIFFNIKTLFGKIVLITVS